MGSLVKSSSLLRSTMKTIAVVALCLFAAVAGEAEAEATAAAEPGYGYYGHGYGHLGYGHGYGHGYYGHGYHYGKRSADDEPAAEATLAATSDSYCKSLNSCSLKLSWHLELRGNLPPELIQGSASDQTYSKRERYSARKNIIDTLILYPLISPC